MDHFNCCDLIIKKRDGKSLSKREIEYFINGLTNGDVQAAQIGAMLMAIYVNGMTSEEATHLTNAMMTSGEILRWPNEWKGRVVDKHSTGGVGDKVSLPLVPALAACGLKVPMISGRGLEFTGGTIDKLESIPGIRLQLTSEDMLEMLDTVGCCVVGQTEKLVPADRVLYATRDITGTVDNNGLIIGSIISKKAAESIDGLVLDIKFGRATFKKTLDDARELAQSMVDVCKDLGIRTTALLSKMDVPVGKAIGNALEVAETIQCLHGKGPSSLVDLVCHAGGNLLYGAGFVESVEEGMKQIDNCLNDGTAMAKFCKMIKGQGVKEELAERLCDRDQDVFQILPAAQYKKNIASSDTGYVHDIDAMKCAKICQFMGAGRSHPGEAINYAVGVELKVQLGDFIREGDCWTTIHHDDPLPEEVITEFQTALRLDVEPVSTEQKILVTESIRNF